MKIYQTTSLRSTIASLLLLFFLASTTGRGQSQTIQAFDSVLLNAKSTVEELTSTKMMGRGYTQAGHVRAAEYIQRRFSEIGLNEINGSAYQTFTVTVDTFLSTPKLTLQGVPLHFGEDFILNPGNRGGSWNEVPILNLGSGLHIEGHLTDYRDKQVKGSLVLIDSAIPDSISGDSTISRDLLSRDYRTALALKAGAEGVLMLVDRPTYGNFFERWPKPVFEVCRDSLPSLIRSAGSLRTASYAVEREGNVMVTTQNVLGLLPGRGESDSIVMICGHYDHLGAVGDSTFFPGANDNGSGIAMMLALAETFARNPLQYDILFVAFSGEEIGLRGSKFFAENPPMDLSRIRFLVNLDMVASGLDGVMALGGEEFTEEFALLREAADSLGINDLRKRANAPNSDHWFLLEKGVRGFYIYPFVGHQPYHHVHDEPETLQWETFATMYRLLSSFVRSL